MNESWADRYEEEMEATSEGFSFNDVIDIEEELELENSAKKENIENQNSNIMNESWADRYEEEMEATSEGFSFNDVIDVEEELELENSAKKENIKKVMEQKNEQQQSHLIDEKVEIKQFFQKYEIREEKPLGHNDVYAFLSQVKGGEGREELKKIFELIVNKKIEIDKSLTKNEMLQKVVYPIKEANKELEFKKEMKEFLSGKKNQVQEITNKYDSQSIKDYYLAYSIEPEKKLNHHDIYAFLNQKGNKKELIEIAKNITGTNIELNTIDKTTILKEVIYPIKEANKELEFKAGLVTTLLKKIEVKIEKGKELNVENIDKLMGELIENPLLINNLMSTSISDEGLKSLDCCIEERNFSKGKEVLLNELSNQKDLQQELVEVIQKGSSQKMKR